MNTELMINDALIKEVNISHGTGIFNIYLDFALVYGSITNSTTMIFKSKVDAILKRDEKIIHRRTDDVHPFEYKLFSSLKKGKRILKSPLPGYSTHRETAFLSPLINWRILL